MDYLSKLVAKSLEAAGWVMGLLTVIIGVILGLWVAGYVTLNEQDVANLGIWATIGGAVAFVFYLLLRGPYLLYRDEREAREKAEEEQPYSVMNIGTQLNFHTTLPSGTHIQQATALLIRGPQGEGLLLPAGTVSREFTADAYIAPSGGAAIADPYRADPRSPEESTRDPQPLPPSQE